jgi:hypothetical protein|tara:strand:+ start:708 stop:983 length:276 start_codon:yes stop_codon:yes gene_type:complete
MINITEARAMMPTKRMSTILDEIESLIVEAANNDKQIVEIPEGFFGRGQEHEIVYNAKFNPLFDTVKKGVESQGFKLGRKELKFFISWADQ